MKVIEDKVTVYPPHSICKADIAVILSLPPPVWIEGIKTVRLCASQRWPLRCAFCSSFDHTLTIYSHGLTKEQTIQATLTEWAARGLNAAKYALERTVASRERHLGLGRGG